MPLDARHSPYPRSTQHAIACCLVGLLLVAMCLCPASAQEQIVPEGRVVRLTLPIDNQQVTGVIVRYDTLTLTLRTDEGQEHRLLWNALPAPNVDRYWRFLVKPEGDSEALYELGDLLIRHRDGKALAEKAFEEALALDPQLAEAIERSRQGITPDGTPRYAGDADPAMWGQLTDAQMQQGVDTLRAFSEKAQKQLNIELSLYESDRFMVLTDVDAKEVQDLAQKLVETYRATAELLGDDPDANVFVGKCLVVLFANRVDYIRFQRDLHGTDARGTGGLCHGFGNGHVHIAAYARNNARQTRHVLAHELTHAYLHRYRSPVPIVDWLNEGLAEHIAHRVEPPPGNSNLFFKSRLALEGKEGLGEGFFTADKLESWQYDVAGGLTGFLIERSDKAYPKLLQLLKDKTPVEEALQAQYRMDSRELTQRFKRRLDRELNDKLGQ